MYTKRRKYSIDQIQQINERLGYGDKKEISERVGCHRNHVHNVMSGAYYDQKVVDAALEVLSDKIEQAAKLDNHISKAVEAIDHLRAIAAL